MKLKVNLLITTAVLGILFNTSAATPQEEARFLVEVKSAFEKKDSKAFLDLFCWDRVPPFIKSVSEKTAPATVALKVDTITLVPASPETAGTEFVRDGVTYRPNLPVTKQIEVAHSYAGGKGKVTMPVGEKDGKLFITTAAPSK
jgi:hypothetical protein